MDKDPSRFENVILSVGNYDSFFNCFQFFRVYSVFISRVQGLGSSVIASSMIYLNLGLSDFCDLSDGRAVPSQQLPDRGVGV